MTRSSTESKTSLAIAANLSELELKKILIEKMESNKRRDDEDKDKEPSTGSNQGSKRKRAGKEQSQPVLQRKQTSKNNCKSNMANGTLLDSQHLDESAQIDTLTPGIIPSNFKLMKVYKATIEKLDWHGREVMPFYHFINNDLAYLSGGVSSHTYATSVTKTKAADYGRKRQQFYGFAANRESACDVYSKRRIIAVTKLQIVEWHGYKHLDWITVSRYDNKLYTFKEGDFKQLHLQDIEDMLILLVQGKLTNLNVEDPYSYPRGFIYLNKDKKNRLMRIDELHKFSEGTLDDVRTVLNDRLKGIRMEYLPKTIWRQSDRE
ncbi:hypothetical protein Tco_1103224 [Tanacetum coccineum]